MVSFEFIDLYLGLWGHKYALSFFSSCFSYVLLALRALSSLKYNLSLTIEADEVYQNWL